MFSATPIFDIMICSACGFHRLRCDPEFTRCRKCPQFRKMKTARVFVTMTDYKKNIGTVMDNALQDLSDHLKNWSTYSSGIATFSIVYALH